jgi:hypothetical protein
MKTLRYPTLLLGLCVLTGSLGAKDFEGMIRMKMTSEHTPARDAAGDGTMFMDYYLKGGLIRIDMNTGKGQVFSSIMDSRKREMTILMPAQKMYMVRQLPEATQSGGTAEPVSDVQFVRTGKTETILGYKCEEIIVKSRNGDADIWGAEGLGTFQGMVGHGPMGGGAPKNAWEAALAEHGFFPLRMVSHDKSGKEQMRMEAVSIDPQPPADSLFVPPADFHSFQMPDFDGMNPMGRKGD